MKQHIDQAAIDLYEDEFLRHADLVKQFAFALTLSQKRAFELTKSVYEKVLLNMAQHSAASQKKDLLLKLVYEAAAEGGKGSGGADKTPGFVSVFQKFSQQERAVCYLVDGLGYLVEEVGRVFLRMDEREVRTILAHCREKTMQGLS